MQPKAAVRLTKHIIAASRAERMILFTYTLQYMIPTIIFYARYEFHPLAL